MKRSVLSFTVCLICSGALTAEERRATPNAPAAASASQAGRRKLEAQLQAKRAS